MRYITDSLDFQMDTDSVVTLGKFDGLHRGHRKLIERVREISAKSANLQSVLFTFDVSPLIRLGTSTAQTLLTGSERRRLLRESGMDCVIECPFVPEIIHMDAELFLRDILVRQLRTKAMVVGPDFCFGHNRLGTVDMLKAGQQTFGYHLEMMQKETDKSRVISSTYIRDALQKGDMELVDELLGYPWFIEGKIVHGRQLGRTIGLPTINQVPPPDKLLPPRGVYISRTLVAGHEIPGITNIGCKPTVEGASVGAETYLFDWSGDLYGQDASVQLYHFCRPEKRFSSVEKLKEQIEKDVQAGKEYFRVKGTTGGTYEYRYSS